VGARLVPLDDERTHLADSDTTHVVCAGQRWLGVMRRSESLDHGRDPSARCQRDEQVKFEFKSPSKLRAIHSSTAPMASVLAALTLCAACVAAAVLALSD
jgi:hypothetical protein